MSSASQQLPIKQHGHQTLGPMVAQGLGVSRTPRLGGCFPAPNISWAFLKLSAQESLLRALGSCCWSHACSSPEEKARQQKYGVPSYLRVWWGAARGLRREISSSRGWVVPPGKHTWGVDEPSLEAPAFFSRCPNQQGTPLCAPKVLPQHLPLQTPTPWT